MADENKSENAAPVVEKLNLSLPSKCFFILFFQSVFFLVFFLFHHFFHGFLFYSSPFSSPFFTSILTTCLSLYVFQHCVHPTHPLPLLPYVHHSVLETIKLSQSQNGLRHGDYMRYRQYCTRRIARLRKSLKMQCGKKSFRKNVVEAQDVTNERFLLIPLMDAERAWSYAMDLKESVSEENSRPRFHCVKRLQRAVSHAKHLEELCHLLGDTRTELESEAYRAFLEGTLLLEKESYPDALKQFAKAKAIFTQLSKVSDPEQKGLCNEKVAQIEPNIRYCTYVLKRIEGSVDSDLLKDLQAGTNEILQSKLESILVEQSKAQADGLSVITWRETKVPIKNEKVRLALVEAQQLTAQIQEFKGVVSTRDEFDTRMDIYTRLFVAYEDGLQVIRNEIIDFQKGFKGTSKKHQLIVLELLRNYITYHKLHYTDLRNQLLVGDYISTLAKQESGEKRSKKKVRPDDIVVLFDRCLQTVDAISLCRKEDISDEEEKKKAVKDTPEINAKRAYYEAQRVYYLALSYSALGKFAEGYVLFEKSLEVTKDALNKQKSCAIADTDAVENLNKLVVMAEGQMCVVKARAIIQKGSGPSSDQVAASTGSANDPTLMDRVNDYDGGHPSNHHKILDFPAAYVAAPAKPVLFDLAFNSVEYPDVADRYTEESTPTKEEPKQGGGKGGNGWFSWMTGR